MLSNLFTLQNPFLAPIALLVAVGISAFGLAYLALRLGENARGYRRIEEHAGTELAYLETQLRACESDIRVLQERIVAQKVAISLMVLHLQKALNAAVDPE